MNKPFIVAEMSANHLGSLERALAIVDAAADAGADAVKLQTWTHDMMCVDAGYVINHGAWAGRLLRDLYREAYLSWYFHQPIFERCKKRGIECFSAPFDRESVDFLEKLDCPRYKIASFEITDRPLIEYAARKGKPIILSTGVASYIDISNAYCVVYFAGCNDITLLKCTSAYPADASDANLAMMAELKNTFECHVGLSDHSVGLGVAVAAATLGATMIEKHLTLSRADGGPDAAFSMEPDEFKQMVTECRRAASAVGELVFPKGDPELGVLRRSLWVVKDIQKGELLTMDNVRTARPALGIAPIYLSAVINGTASQAIKAGTLFSWEMMQ